MNHRAYRIYYNIIRKRRAEMFGDDDNTLFVCELFDEKRRGQFIKRHSKIRRARVHSYQTRLFIIYLSCLNSYS